MPVLKKQIELDDGTLIWVRQASGMDKLRIENVQARTFRKFREYGLDPSEWTEEQHAEFAEELDAAGGGMEDQIQQWVPNSIIDEEVDIDSLTSNELRKILLFVRGDDDEGAIPLGHSSE